MPKVSVCIPTYNGARYLPEALESLDAQTYTDTEVIVSDDGSTDGTLEIASEYQRNSAFPVMILNHQRNSLAGNWNHCIDHASGEYIKFLFQDDLLKPDCIRRMVELADSERDVALVFSPRELVVERDAASNEICQFIIDNCTVLHNAWTRLERVQDGHTLLSDPALIAQEPRNKIGEPSVVLLRKSTLNQIGGFRPELSQLVDLEMWWRIMGHAQVGFIDEPLACFRVHASQESVHNHESGKSAAEEKLFADIVLASPYADAVSQITLNHLQQISDGAPPPSQFSERLWTIPSRFISRCLQPFRRR